MFARPGLPSFDYVRAATAEEVVTLLQQHGEAARLLMGGTDLFPAMRDGAARPRVVIDLKHLPGIRAITYDCRAGLTVGAAATMNQLAGHPEVEVHYGLLAEAARTVASYQIRNRATYGGNLCNASPCADGSPAALVLEARLLLCGPAGERAVPAAQFFLGPGRTALQAGEFLTAVSFPPPPSGTAACYHKLGRCRAGDLALVGVAVMGYRDGTPSGYRFRIGLGSVGPVPLRALEAEQTLAAQPLGEKAFGLAAEKAMAASSPITDVRGTAAYQKEMVGALTRRGLRDVWARLKEGE